MSIKYWRDSKAKSALKRAPNLDSNISFAVDAKIVNYLAVIR